MDRNQVTFKFKAFKAMLPICDGYPSLKRMIKDLQVSTPTALKETLATDGMLATWEAYAVTNKNPFADAVDGFTKLVDIQLEKLGQMADSEFVPSRGKDGTKTQVMLFGKTDSLVNHAFALIKGSKLAEIFAKGPGEGFNDWSALSNVLNQVKAGCSRVIPVDQRKKRATPAEQLAELRAKLAKTVKDTAKVKLQAKIDALDAKVNPPAVTEAA